MRVRTHVYVHVVYACMYVYVHMYVCMHACEFVCLYWTSCLFVYVCLGTFMHVTVCVCTATVWANCLGMYAMFSATTNTLKTSSTYIWLSTFQCPCGVRACRVVPLCVCTSCSSESVLDSMSRHQSLSIVSSFHTMIQNEFVCASAGNQVLTRDLVIKLHRERRALHFTSIFTHSHTNLPRLT
jgi:hypothetical protein